MFREHGRVAVVVVTGGDVLVRLNIVERIAALRWVVRAPLEAVTSVELLGATPPAVVDELVRMGLAASTAPLRAVATVGPHARSVAGGAPAFVVSYFGGPAALIRFDTTRSPWGLFLIGSPHAAETCRDVQAAANPTRS